MAQEAHLSARGPHLTRPLDAHSRAASTSSLMDIDGVAGEATLIDVERGRDQTTFDPDQASFHKTGGGTYTKRIKYYIPGTDWIPNYKISLLGGDVLAGITVASMLIPQSVSYATSLAQMSPLTGLFSASIPGMVYAFLGTCRQLNVAPEAAISLLLGQAIGDILLDFSDPHSDEAEVVKIAISTIITMQVGLFAFLLGFFRLGFIDVVLSRALLRGFVSAIAVVILTEQLVPMLGLTTLIHQVHPESTFDKVLFLLEYAFTHSNITTTVISFSALAVIIAIRAIKGVFQKYWFIYRLPEILLVVVFSTILSEEFRWDQDGVEILGAVPMTSMKSFMQFPLQASNLKYLRRTTSTSMLIAVVGFLDSIVAAKQNASRFGYSISPNRELVALGASNLAASFIPGTLPAWGSITRSRINGDVGARTQMASLVCSVIVLLATFFLLPWLFYLPKCVLSAIICLVVFSLLHEAPRDIAYYWKMSAWVDLSLMFLTFFSAIVWNIEIGITLSLIASLLLVVHRSSKTRMTILGRIPGTERWKPINENPEAEEDVAGALIVRIRENLDFANTAQLKERLRRLELYGLNKSHPSEEPRRANATVLVFHMADVETCDASAIEMFYELCEEYKSRHVRLFVTHLRPLPLAMFSKAGIFDLLGHEAFQLNVADAMTRIEGYPTHPTPHPTPHSTIHPIHSAHPTPTHPAHSILPTHQ
ncbi:sulfate anion transporter [Mycena galopus ATCC 62051]|nr:sulfate anion transporter [Mycena galopus ATCC 62051]